MTIQEIEETIRIRKARREETLPPSIKQQVRVAEEQTQVLLENALQGARTVQALQDLTRTLQTSLSELGERLEAFRKEISPYSRSTVVHLPKSSLGESFEDGGGI